jgi:hypothetical protein
MSIVKIISRKITSHNARTSTILVSILYKLYTGNLNEFPTKAVK